MEEQHQAKSSARSRSTVFKLAKRHEEKKLKKQFPVEVAEISSEYDSTSWSRDMLLGTPRVYPNAGDNTAAWTHSGFGNFEHMVLKYKKFVEITAVDVYETQEPGGVVRISAFIGKNVDEKDGAQKATEKKDGKEKEKEVKGKKKKAKGPQKRKPVVGPSRALKDLNSENWVVLWEGAAALDPSTTYTSRKFSPPLKVMKEVEGDADVAEVVGTGVISNTIRIDIDARAAGDNIEIDTVRLRGWLAESPKKTPTSLDSIAIGPCPLGEALAPLVGDATFSDVLIRLDDDSIFPAHRNILAYRSDVFKAMLTGGMRESGQPEVRIGEMTKEVLQLLMTFLYTDNVTVEGDLVVPLFIAADRYNLQRLKDAMVEEFRSYLTVDNVVELMNGVLDLPPLAQACKGFIWKNYKVVAQRQDFESLPHGVLVEFIRASLGQ